MKYGAIQVTVYFYTDTIFRDERRERERERESRDNVSRESAREYKELSRVYNYCTESFVRAAESTTNSAT